MEGMVQGQIQKQDRIYQELTNRISCRPDYLQVHRQWDPAPLRGVWDE